MADVREYVKIVEAAQLYKSLAQRPSFSDELSLTKTQDCVLHVLYLLDEMTMSDLARHMGVSKEQASRAVSVLEGRCLVARRHSSENKRLVFVSITEEGMRLMDCRNLEYCSQLEGLLGALSEEETEALFECSQRASALIRKALGRREADLPSPLEDL